MTKDLSDRVDLRKDLIFRAVFGDGSANYVLQCLLNAVLEQAGLPLIAELELQNPFQLPAMFDRKSSIMDIHAADENGRRFDVETQVQPEKFFCDRLLYYGAGVYQSSLDEGEEYGELPKVVCVAFVSFPINATRPDVWFDKWQMHSTLGTGLGTDKMTNVFVRLPRVSRSESSPLDVFAGQLSYWVRILSSYSVLTEGEKLELSRSTRGFSELEERIRNFFGTEEGKRVFIAQRKVDEWLNRIQTEEGTLYEQEHKARCEAERGREEAERGREEERRGREEAERRGLELQKKGVVRLFKNKFGSDSELPENWAEGLSYDELETLADKIFASSSLQEVLDLLR